MARGVEQIVDQGLFHHLARIHHINPVAKLCDHAQVVRDHHDRALIGLSQIAQQMQNLRLGRDIQRGGGFIGHQNLRVHQQGRRNRHPLAHSARKLVRVAAQDHIGIRKPHQRQLVPRAGQFVAIRGAALVLKVDQMVANRQHRVKGRHRVLKDHRHCGAAQRPLCLRSQGQDIFAQKAHRTARDLGRGGQKVHHRRRQR